MKANELRIGNYVTCDLGGILKIKGITLESDTWHLRGITITKQWLLKFGFMERKIGTDFSTWTIDKSFIPNDIFVINQFKLDSSYFFSVDEYSIHYIHQLQNLYFELTKKELIYETSSY